MPSDGVDFVHEKQAGSVLAALIKEVAHAAGADADEHLHEFAARGREEGNARFAGDGFGEEGLARSRGAVEQDPLGDLAAQLLKFRRILQKLNDFTELFLGLVAAGHVRERDLGFLAGLELGFAAAEGHRLLAAALHLADHQEPEKEEDQRPAPKFMKTALNQLLVRLAGIIADLVAVQIVDERRDR